MKLKKMLLTLTAAAVLAVSIPFAAMAVNGGETEWIATGGSREGAWRVGQRVQVLYDPARPGEYALDGDAAPMHAVRADFIWAVVLTAAGAALLALYFI